MSEGRRIETAHATMGPLLLLVLLTVAASAIVAISAKDLRLLLPPFGTEGEWVRVVRGIGAAAAAVGSTVLILRRRRKGTGRLGSPDPTARALRTAATIMGFLTLVALLTTPPLDPGDAERPAPRVAGSEPEPDQEPGTEVRRSSSRTGGIRWGGGGGSGGRGSGSLVSGLAETQPEQSFFRGITGNLPLIFLLAAAAVLFLLLSRRFRRRRVTLDPGLTLAPDEVAAGLEASLELVIREGGDPRQQVTAAYHRLLVALAAAGAPRRVQEAPHEHLHRALGPLGVEPRPLHQLAALYVMAQFSRRAVTEGHRTAAVRALETSLDTLRQVVRSSGADGVRPHPPEAYA